ncbi:hypothetical protein [Paracoccus yeei]|uniref:hypothetical protein n=1 Tax=Paracoccus yeei TaxID=147645 RepID=UPI0011B0EC45|nr:hypothetical protein [Paracoccus yeei]
MTGNSDLQPRSIPAAAPGSGCASALTASGNGENKHLPTAAQSVRIAVRKVATSRVTVSTRTEEIDQNLPAELASVDGNVVRVAVDRKSETM